MKNFHPDGYSSFLILRSSFQQQEFIVCHVQPAVELPSHLPEQRHLTEAQPLVHPPAVGVLRRDARHERVAPRPAALLYQPAHQCRADAPPRAAPPHVHRRLPRPCVCRPLLPRMGVSVALHPSASVRPHEVRTARGYLPHPPFHLPRRHRLHLESRRRVEDVFVINLADGLEVRGLYFTYHSLSVLIWKTKIGKSGLPDK